MLIFQQLFSVYSLKLSLACIFAKEGVLRSTSPHSFSSLSCDKALSASALECHFIATQWSLVELKRMMRFMLGCTSSSFFLSPSKIKGNFQDHCVVDSLVLVVSNPFCLFPFGKHGKNVFCGLCLFIFWHCWGVLIRVSVSAHLHKYQISHPLRIGDNGSVLFSTAL